MKKILNKAWLFLVFLALFSCRTEEIIVSMPTQNQEYTNKSLSKEDEVFTKNVKKIYEKNADENRMQSQYGKIFWDYASTMNTFNESYLLAPILKDNKVVSYVEVKKNKGRVFFDITENDKNVNDFFNTLIFTEKEKLSVAETPPNTTNIGISNSIESAGTLICKTVTKTIIVGYVEGGGPDQGGEMTSTTTTIVCKFVDRPVSEDLCIGEYDAQGNCTGTGDGGTGDGYSYAEPEEEEDNPCNKFKKIGKNAKTKTLLGTLNTKKNTPDANGKYNETGYLLTDNNGNVTEQEVVGVVGENIMKFGITNPIDGYIHNHNPGALSIFSPYDLATLALMYKGGKIKDTSSFVFGVITSSGTLYMITISDVSAFNTFANQFITGNTYNEEFLYKLDTDYYMNSIMQTNNINNNEAGFLHLLEKYNMGLSVLKGDNTFNNWSKIEKGYNDQIINNPCN